MIKFSFNQTEFEKLKVFNEYLNKLKGITLTNPKQLFCINNSKLEVFAIGEEGSSSSIQAETIIDITNLQNVIDQFTIELKDLIFFVTKKKDMTVVVITLHHTQCIVVQSVTHG